MDQERALPSYQSRRDQLVYDHYWRHGSHYEPSNTFVTMLDRLGAQSRTEMRVADLGCGIGRHAIYAAEHGARVVAVDHSEQALTRLREETEVRGLSVEAIKGDFVTWSKAHRGLGLDGVVCFDAVHHVAPSKREVVEALEAMASTVRMGGLLLITVLSDIDYGLGGAPEGRFLVSAEEAEQLLDDAFSTALRVAGRRSECRFDTTVNLDSATGTLVKTHYQATRVIRLFQI